MVISLLNLMLRPRLILNLRALAVVVLLLGHLDHGGFTQVSPPPSEDVVANGVQALKAGDLENAQNFLEQALKQGIKHPIVFHNLGVIAQERRNHVQAIAWFRKSLVLDPKYGPSRLLLGSSLLALGKNDEAVRELKRAVRLMPDEPVARLELAKAYESMEDWIRAVAQLQTLTKLAPDNAEYCYQLAKALTKLSGWSLQELSRVSPNAARLHQALGQEYAIQGKYDLALSAYQLAEKADPKLPEIHLGMALILLELKRLDDALAQVDMELALVPDSKVAADTKAKIEAEKGATQ